jgi:hypothetical protein
MNYLGYQNLEKHYQILMNNSIKHLLFCKVCNMNIQIATEKDRDFSFNLVWIRYYVR